MVASGIPKKGQNSIEWSCCTIAWSVVEVY